MPTGDYPTTVRQEEVNAPLLWRYGFADRTMSDDETWQPSAATFARLATGGADRTITLYDPLLYRGLRHEITCVGPGVITLTYGGSDVASLGGGQRVEVIATESGWVKISNGPAVTSSTLVEVSSQSDLPAPVAGVITLDADTAYHITAHITTDPGVRFVLDGIVAIYGTSSETASLTGSDLGGQPYITSQYSLPMRDLTITATGGPAVSIDGSAFSNVAAIDWRAVNFVDTPSVGTIKDVSNFIHIDSAYLNSSGLQFDGTIGTVGFDSSLFIADAGGTSMEVLATATISRRLRIVTSSFVAASGATSIAISDPSVFSSKESYILDFCNFSGGGSYLTGTTATNSEALFTRNVGVDNSAAVAHYYMNGNATVSTISITGTPVKIAGTTTSGPLVSEFDQTTTNRAVHEGVLTEYYVVSINAACASGNNNEVSVLLATGTGEGAATPRTDTKMTSTANGTGRVESISTQGVVLLGTDDYFEVWVANETATTNITVTDLQVIARRIS